MQTKEFLPKCQMEQDLEWHFPFHLGVGTAVPPLHSDRCGNCKSWARRESVLWDSFSLLCDVKTGGLAYTKAVYIYVCKWQLSDKAGCSEHHPQWLASTGSPLRTCILIILLKTLSCSALLEYVRIYFLLQQRSIVNDISQELDLRDSVGNQRDLYHTSHCFLQRVIPFKSILFESWLVVPVTSHWGIGSLIG